MKRVSFLSILTAATLLMPSLRAEVTSLELILDCSASMWNKLEDGRYRIDGAKQVLLDFITTTEASPDIHVGLRIYGSTIAFNKEGACEDSHLIVPVEGFDRSRMLEAVRGARAIGATPLARSLELAKEDFQKEGTRRLIVFTDGEESCGGDVKAALDALKMAGIGVDVRIIGIGLTQKAAQRFSEMGVAVENVHSAKKLAEALGKASDLKPAEATKAALTVKLTKDGRPFTGATPSMVGALNGQPIALKPSGGGTFTGEAKIGIYEIQVGKRKFDNIGIQQREPNEFVIDLTEAPKVELWVEPEKGGRIGDEMSVHFKNAKGLEHEFVTIAPQSAPDLAEPAWAEAGKEKEGSVKLRVFGEPGTYEARFIAKVNGENVLAGRSAAFELTLPEITLKVPTSVPAATSFEIEWTGPANEADWIGWVKAGAKDGDYTIYDRPKAGNNILALPSPPEPGDYEIRYANDHESRVLARVPLKVVASEYALKAADSIMAGTAVEIVWSAPKSPGVFVTIVQEGADPGASTEYFYTAEAASPIKLQAPRTLGKHEIRIVSEQTHAVLFKRPIIFTEMKATLDAPAKAKAESSIDVKWTGPNGKGDFITVVAPDAEEGAYLEYFYANDTANEGKGELKLPQKPGSYELRYIADNKVVARKPITIN